jgi:hypothetical protein
MYKTVLTHGGNGAVHDLNGLKLSSGVMLIHSSAQEDIKKAAFARLLGWVPMCIGKGQEVRV